jgi:hypothetical protein
MPWLAGVRKEAFKRTEQANIGDGQTEFFIDFTYYGLGAGFAKFDSATDWAKEWLSGNGVVRFVNQYLAIVMEDAEREGADAG